MICKADVVLLNPFVMLLNHLPGMNVTYNQYMRALPTRRTKALRDRTHSRTLSATGSQRAERIDDFELPLATIIGDVGCVGKQNVNLAT